MNQINNNRRVVMKRLINISLIVILLFNNIPSGVAQVNIDSLIDVLETDKGEIEQLNILMSISGSLFRTDQDKGIKYSEQAIALAEKLNRKEDLAYALKNLGLNYYFKSDFRGVIPPWTRSLAVFREIEHVTGIANLLSNLGAVYESQADYSKALEFAIESLKYAELSEDQYRIATSLVNIGTIYAEDKETYDKAQETYERAIEESKELNKPDLSATIFVNLGELLLHQDKAREALPYFQKAFEEFSSIGDANTAYTLNFISKTYQQLGQYTEALNYANQAYDAAEAFDSKIEMSQAAITRGEIYKEQYNSAKSIASFKEAEKIALELETNKELSQSYDGLSKSYAQSGNFKKAYEFQQKNINVNDDIRSTEYDEIINNLRFKLDLETKEKEIEILNKENALKQSEISYASTIQKFLLALGGLMLVVIGGVTYLYQFSQKTNKLLAEERNRFEKILLNILPKDTADELQEKGFVEAKKFDQTTVLFTDFKGFTSFSEQMSPEDMVKSIDFYFSKFDEIIGRYNLEKIKTIGDAYMCAGGLPTKNRTNAKDAVLAGLEILSFVKEVNENPPKGVLPLEIRIGISTGSTVAGIVGTKKFQYDIWGSTVNIASRMESASDTGKINISDKTYNLIKDEIQCTYRGEIEVKNGLKLKMYYVSNEEHVDYRHNLDFTKGGILN